MEEHSEKLGKYSERLRKAEELGKEAAESYCEMVEEPTPEDFYEWFSQSEEWETDVKPVVGSDGTIPAHHFWEKAEEVIRRTETG